MAGDQRGVRPALNMPSVPLNPKAPDRVCWGCEKYCPADQLACGNGTIRTPHPVELFGEDWISWIESRRGNQPTE